MENSSEKVTEGTWFEVVNDSYYMLQNNGANTVLVKASEEEPTNESGSFRLENGGVITSFMLTGRIWATAADKSSVITYAK